MLASNKSTGDQGERDVVKKVQCPNCTKDLMLLPTGYPLCDVQCTACHFRAQIKTSSNKPKDIIRGAGWDIMSKVLRAGNLVPPLIVNFVWQEKGKKRQEIRFYPFIRKTDLKKYIADIKSRDRQYKMFNYYLQKANYYVLYQK